MELVNLTPVTAKVLVTTPPRGARRLGMVVAKATFSLTGGSTPRLAPDVAETIHEDDVEAPDGLLPGDLVPRRDDSMEVIVLGHAGPVADQPVAKLTVGLRVGAYERQLAVIGDRRWIDRPGSPAISEPEPFTSMPLCWSRAFGGRADVWIDRKAPIEVADPINRRGRGFDPRPLAEALCRHLEAPAGYPLVPKIRTLPNLEDPGCLIRRPGDRPIPACWATVPRDVGIGMAPVLHELEQGRPVDSHQAATLGVLHRCHPAWVLPPLPREAPIRWWGLGPGADVRLPALRVLADALVGQRRSTLELRPQVLVLRPDLRRLHLTYRGFFCTSAPEPGPRIMRLRLDEGWMQS